jgi:hypothetical protein
MAYPVDKWEEAPNVFAYFAAIGENIVKPLPGSRLALDVRIRRLNREHTLSTCYAL